MLIRVATATSLCQHDGMIGMLLGLWLVCAVAVGATGALREASLPPPAIAMLLTILAVGVVWLVPAVQTRVRALGAGPMVAFHLIRLAVGIYFLVLAASGSLPDEFARVAGWGDIVIGLGVLPVLMFCQPALSPAQRTGLMLWNTAGLLDILIVLGNGIRLLRPNPELAVPFTHLPLALLPLFIVPLVISTHLWIFAWFVRGPAVAPPPEPLVRPPTADH